MAAVKSAHWSFMVGILNSPLIPVPAPEIKNRVSVIEELRIHGSFIPLTATPLRPWETMDVHG